MKTVPAAAPKFFLFDQNNSGGTFKLNMSLAHYVFIEAASAAEANTIAESFGIEFGVGCSCCGDRWTAVCDGDGLDSPMIYDTPVEQYDASWLVKPGETFCRVFYLNGIVKEYIKGERLATENKITYLSARALAWNTQKKSLTD